MERSSSSTWISPVQVTRPPGRGDEHGGGHAVEPVSLGDVAGGVVGGEIGDAGVGEEAEGGNASDRLTLLAPPGSAGG